MEFLVVSFMSIILIFILFFIFGVNMKKLKNMTNIEELDNISNKYPSNINICKEYLKKLNNENVQIEENVGSDATVYIAVTNKISIGNLKNSYTRIQTIAHECLHSIQNKKLLWFNFIFSNIYLLYFAIIFLLGIFKVLPYKMLFMAIFLILSLVYYAVRTYLENDAMIKARFLAKEYMEDVKISTKEEIEKIIARYDELNDIGIKFTNFQFLSKILLKVFILVLIFIIF